MKVRDGNLLTGISKAGFSYLQLNDASARFRISEVVNPKLQKVMMKYLLSDYERDAIWADLNGLIALRDNTHNALEGGSMNLAQRESRKKALPVPEGKIKTLNEKLTADCLLHDCDKCNIPKHYQDRPR